MRRRLLLGISLAGVAIIGLMVWMLSTESGLNWSYQQARVFLPGKLKVDAFQGRLIGPMILKGVEYQQEGNSIKLDQVAFDWKPIALFKSLIQITQLQIQGVEIKLAPTETADPASGTGQKMADFSLPLQFSLQNVTIDDTSLEVGGQGYRINKVALNVSALNQRIDLETLRVEAEFFSLRMHGNIVPDAEARHQLMLNWQASLPSGAQLSGSGELAGNLKKSHFTHQVNGALEAQIEVDLLDTLHQFNWLATVNIAAFDATLLASDLPALRGSIELQAKGDMLSASLSGELNAQLEQVGAIDADFELQRLVGNSLQLDKLNLRLSESDSQLKLRGLWRPDAQSGVVDLDFDWRNLRWPLQGMAEFESASGSGNLAGSVANYRISLASDSPWPRIGLTRWQAEAEGNALGLNLQSLQVSALDGELAATARLDWSKGLNWQTQIRADGINPAVLSSEWPGKLNAQLSSKGEYKNGQLRGDAEIGNMEGQLRDYPVSLQSELVWDDKGLKISAFTFNSGGTSLTAQGQLGDEFDLDWTLLSNNLAELYPQAQGLLQSQGKLTGPRAAPTIEATVKGKALRMPGYQVAQLEGNISVDLLTRQQVDIKLTASELEIQGYALKSLRLSANQQGLQLTLDAAQANAQVELNGTLGEDSWQGRVTRAAINSKKFDNWKLKAPAALTIKAQSLSSEALCWLSSQGAEICGTPKHGAAGSDLGLLITALPLKLVQPWLPTGLELDSSASASAQFSYQEASGLQGSAQLRLAAGSASYPLRGGEPERFEYREGRINTSLESRGISLDASFNLVKGDRLSVKLELPEARLPGLNFEQQVLQANLLLKLQNPALVESIFPEISDLKGALELDFTLAGTLAQPRLKGRGQFSDGAFRVAKLGLDFDYVNAVAETEGFEKLNLEITAVSVGGQFNLQGQVKLDAETGWPGQLRIRVSDFDISGLAQPWLPADLNLEGRANANAELQFNLPDQLLGRVQLELPTGAASYALLEGEPSRWEYSDGKVLILIEQQGLQANTELTMKNGDFLNGSLQLPGARLLAFERGTQKLQANAQLRIQDLSLIEALLPETSKISGEMSLNLDVDGTFAAPRLNGRAQLSKAGFRIPRLGLTISDLSFNAESEGSEALNYRADAQSGGGKLSITGRTRLDPATGWPSVINIKGESFEVARIPEARVLVSPNLEVKIQHQSIDVQGELVIPYARLQPKDISSAAKVSDDTVIIGGEQEIDQKWLITTRTRLILGDRVNFSGFGFEGRFGGSLLLEDEPGQLTRATGELNIPEGRYRAYGQKLEVEHGRLIYTGGPLTNPGLDLRAVRSVNNVIAGLKVKGSLSEPQLELFSIPSMGQTDALSYLLLGRPMETASGEDGAMMANAALALGLSGGDRLARSLGETFGIDDMRVESNETGDQASLVVGRYLSPKLYLSYGVGLIDAINTLTVRYQISSKWQLKAESGEYQGADFLYNIER